MMRVYAWRYITPRGFSDIEMRSDGEFLTELFFVGSRNLPRSDASCMEHTPRVFRDVCRWLDVYFAGRQPDFTPPYAMEGLTPFRREVVNEMLKIPFGETVTYGDIASTMAKRRGIAKMSAQAVGGAVGWNPICIIVPCHRVVGAGGALTGYGGGMKNKVALLALEGREMRRF